MLQWFISQILNKWQPCYILNGNKAYSSGAILSHVPKVCGNESCLLFSKHATPAKDWSTKFESSLWNRSIYVVTGITLSTLTQLIQSVGSIVLQLGNRSSMLLVRRILLPESPCLKCRLNRQSNFVNNFWNLNKGKHTCICWGGPVLPNYKTIDLYIHGNVSIYGCPKLPFY